MTGALRQRAGCILAVAVLFACASPASLRRSAEAPRMPLVHPNDSSWARLDQRCPAEAPIRLASERPMPPEGRVRTRDDHTASLARQVPGGYGGLYWEYDPPLTPGGPRPETRRLIVSLVDTTRREAALRALASERPDLDLLRATIKPARWSFAELYDWYGWLLPRAVREGVVTTDIDEVENRIVFGVEHAEGRRLLERQLAGLGLPCFLIGIRVPGRRIPG